MYYGWRSLRYPSFALMEKGELLKFVQETKVKNVGEITEMNAKEYVLNKSSQFQILTTKKVLRNFLKYYSIRGHRCLAENKITC